MEKMIMEGKLASELMDRLACLYLSAYGDGTIDTYYELTEKAQEYARAKFIELADEFESATGKQWDVTPYEEEDPPLWTTNPMTSTVIADTTPTWVDLRTTADAVVLFFGRSLPAVASGFSILIASCTIFDPIFCAI